MEKTIIQTQKLASEAVEQKERENWVDEFTFP
jgi:hypothetical protein